MNKKIKAAVLILAAALIIAVPTVFIISGSKFAAEIVSPDAETTEKNSDEFLSASGFSKQDFLTRWGGSTEGINYRSVNENTVYFDYICSEKYNYDAPTVIILPDNGMNNYAAAPVADALLSKGINVIMLDLRAHGRNNADTFTFGILEKDDIDAVIDFIKNNYADLPSLGLLGQGAGAVTAAYYISSHYSSDYFDYAILEDPYCSALDYIEQKMKNQKSFLPSSLQRSLTLSAMESKYSFDPDDVNISKMISGTTTPVLIVSQEGCSSYSSQDAETINNAITIEDKSIVTFNEPDYLKYTVSNTEKYSDELYKFITEHTD